ncbi:MAG: YdeI/OmpD-associated family protein [Gemmatimonadales bacterium]
MPTKFLAPLYSVWIMRYVDLPAKERRKFPGNKIPVKGTCNGVPFRGTLVPRKGGGLRVAINAATRKAAGKVDAGDRVVMTLIRTGAHPLPRMPKELAAALAAVPGGRMAWAEKPHNWRRHVLGWVLETKDPTLRFRRAGSVLKRLGLGDQ